MSENKNTTSLNQLKNWFKTGLKPTQEQFWAWMDSYYHKEEKISQENINGLDESLSAKADSAQLEFKANIDATGLSQQDVAAWRNTLGVNDLPENLATVDKENKDGNVYTKEQVTGLLENSEKNIGNTDLTIPEGSVRTLDITGAKLKFKGLENKKTDASYSQRMILTESGDLAVTDEANITVNIPSEFTGNVGMSSMRMEVHHIYPNRVPAIEPYVEQIQEIMGNYKNMVFTLVSEADWVLKVKGDKDLVNNRVYKDGSFSLRTHGSNFGEYSDQERLVELTGVGVELPWEKNWIVKISGSVGSPYQGGGSIYLGVSRSEAEEVSYGISTGNYASMVVMNDSTRVGGRFNFMGLIVKSGGVMTSMLYNQGVFHSRTYNAFTELGKYVPKIELMKHCWANGRVFYKILD